MSEYGITPNGYVKPDLATIMAELITNAYTYFGTDIDLTPASPLYIILNLIALRYLEGHNVAEEFFNAIAIGTSYGRLLDMHGEDVGLRRKSGVNATVTLTFTGDPGTTIPASSRVSTGENQIFETIAEISIPMTIEVVRGSGTSDTIPAIYSGITEIDWISTNSNGTSPFTEGTDYNYVSQLQSIDWSPAGTEPLEGVTYYVGVNVRYELDVSARAVEDGDSYNVPADTIMNLLTPISGIASVTGIIKRYRGLAGVVAGAATVTGVLGTIGRYLQATMRIMKYRMVSMDIRKYRQLDMVIQKYRQLDMRLSHYRLTKMLIQKYRQLKMRIRGG